MKLVVSLTYYTPHISGLTLTAARICENLVKKGHRVTVVCVKHDTALANEEIINGVRVVRASPGWKFNKGYISPDWMIKIIKELKNDRQNRLLIHLPQAEGVWAAVWAKILGIKIICLNHCRVTLPPGRLNKIIEAAMLVDSKLCCMLADKVVYNSADYYYKYKDCKKEKAKFILPPIKDFKENAKLIGNLMRIFGRENFRVGFVGRTAQAKGLDYLIEAINLLPDKIKAKLIIVGPQNTPGEKEYKTLIQNQSKKKTFWYGEAEEDHMGSIIKALKVVVLPAIDSTESFGMVQAEAMKLGVPVVASNLPGVRVPIQLTGMGELAKSQSATDLALALQNIYTGYSRYLNPEKAKQIFNYQNSLDEYEAEIFFN